MVGCGVKCIIANHLRPSRNHGLRRRLPCHHPGLHRGRMPRSPAPPGYSPGPAHQRPLRDRCVADLTNDLYAHPSFCRWKAGDVLAALDAAERGRGHWPEDDRRSHNVLRRFSHDVGDLKNEIASRCGSRRLALALTQKTVYGNLPRDIQYLLVARQAPHLSG